MVKTRFAGDIRQEVLDHLVPEILPRRIGSRSIWNWSASPASPMFISTMEKTSSSKPSLKSHPQFELNEYRGLVCTYAEPQVSDEDVAQRLEQIREQKAEYVNEDPRPLVDGDYAVISLESLSGVAEKVTQDELMLKLGDEATMPVFTENLLGASPDESKEFTVTYPPDYDAKNARRQNGSL